MNQAQWKMESPIGAFYLVANESALTGLYWKKKMAPMASSLKGSSPEIKILSQAVKELEEYFAGKRKTFDIEIDLEGTPFQKQVWAQLRKIPYGKTISYKELALRVKNEKACRAVGTANGRNPISIIVPCHRVIAANGALGGYAGGLNIKTILLDLEKSHR